MEFSEYRSLFKLNSIPCKDAQVWLKSWRSIKAAWENCDRGDWMWWAVTHQNGASVNQKICVTFALSCAERAKQYAVSVDVNSQTVALAHEYAIFARECAAYASDINNNDNNSAACAANTARFTLQAALCASNDSENKIQADWIRENVPYPF
jgi:hypothetical protein